MEISSLHIENFRSFKKSEFNFSPLFNIITGKNSTGKTTILESIYLASSGKSFITTHLLNCVSFNKQYFFISLIFQDSLRKKNIDILIGNGKKEIQLNHKKAKGFFEIIGILPVIFLNYKVVDIIKGGPEKRRNFLNHWLIFTDPSYYSELSNYYTLLYQRNALLKGMNISRELLSILSNKIVPVGQTIQKKRKEIISSLNDIVQKNFYKISGKNVKIEFIYNLSPTEKLLKNGMENTEIQRKRTLFGPHLDELEILMDGIQVREFSSLGEAYSIAFAMRFAEKESIMGKREEEPILLMDDFFADLDETRRENVLRMTGGGQVFLTTLNLNIIPKDVLDKAKIISL